MQTPLNASASSAGALFSNSTFSIPAFQREYSWEEDEVAEFWNDLRNNIDAESYFLGLVILTDEEKRKDVVDGQQRLVTLTLLANALYYEAAERGRNALADRIQADFLRSIDYATDDTEARVELTAQADNETLQVILDTGKPPVKQVDKDSVSSRMVESYEYLRENLRIDLETDPFKRLGKWTEFLTHRVYFAIFLHPDPASAYQVYEIVNTRGKELTTADLLKNYVLSKTEKAKRDARYEQWQAIASQFPSAGTNSFVQYIRHAVTVENGYILPKDLFDFVARRTKHNEKHAPTPEALMKRLEKFLPLYLQMVDPTLPGPAEPEALGIFAALNSLGVISVRPMLLAIADVPDSIAGMRYVLKLVLRRIIVGNLGTGSVERRLGEAAKKIHDKHDWRSVIADLQDLNPTMDDFVEQLRKRSFNKAILTFVRRSIIENSITPDPEGVLHFIWTKQTPHSDKMSEEDGAYWASTIGNTFLSNLDRRPKGAIDWSGFKSFLLPTAVPGEWVEQLDSIEEWNTPVVESLGQELAAVAGQIWYDEK